MRLLHVIRPSGRVRIETQVGIEVKSIVGNLKSVLHPAFWPGED